MSMVYICSPCVHLEQMGVNSRWDQTVVAARGPKSLVPQASRLGQASELSEFVSNVGRAKLKHRKVSKTGQSCSPTRIFLCKYYQRKILIHSNGATLVHK
ncbi:hypothetical protein CDAR_549151 [Caerostris darwini]|uniref:Uncharacterized protein n=1 Tax=Caerostris darwini TaxID=1538125 RepID=A0AAV4WIA8_9ARAC|nr:hypothetical protein CDAR_549151 [Caerostris darwini]